MVYGCSSVPHAEKCDMAVVHLQGSGAPKSGIRFRRSMLPYSTMWSFDKLYASYAVRKADALELSVLWEGARESGCVPCGEKRKG